MMTAQIIEEAPEQEDLFEVIEDSVDAKETEQPEEPKDELPEKYQGKSVKEIIQMHQEAEKLLGRQSSEVGELRKAVDSFIYEQQEKLKAPKEPEVDFFDDPAQAVNQAIENHPKIKQAEEYTEQYRREATISKLQQKHPDYQTIIQDQNFADWIMASKVRQQLYVQADKGMDFDAADELLSTWKERNQAIQQTVEAEKAARKSEVKKASTGNVRGSGESSRKIYRRADIIKLMKEDPDRYASMSDEIMKAYSEGRVK